jgi:DNA-binding Lrp family transcriptional regulator
MENYNNDDFEILAHLRQNSRTNLTKISKETAVPISTIFDRIKRYNKDVIIKNTVLLDFRKIGYEHKVTS